MVGLNAIPSGSHATSAIVTVPVSSSAPIGSSPGRCHTALSGSPSTSVENALERARSVVGTDTKSTPLTRVCDALMPFLSCRCSAPWVASNPTTTPTIRPYDVGVTEAALDGVPAAIVDPADRRFVATLPPGAERDAVVASLIRYRAPDALRPGDPLPAVTVRRADDLEPIELAGLGRGRPLLLVFGSFT